MSEAIAEREQPESGVRRRSRRIRRPTVSGTVMPSIADEIQGYAREQDRTVSYVVGKIIEAGMPVYRTQIGKSDGMVS